MGSTDAPLPNRNVAGLDSLRFVAAAIVVFSHERPFPFDAVLGPGSAVAKVLTQAIRIAFDGQAAVLIFFVISGFCIHYSFACGVPYSTPVFLVRRVLRIALPAAAAALLCQMVGPPALFGLKLVIWSLYCEVIYYLGYPLIRPLLSQRRIGKLLTSSFVVSAALLMPAWKIQLYQEFPLYDIWLVPWPAWLLGCLLAGQWAQGRNVDVPGSVWIWRFITWASSVIALLLQYHASGHAGAPAVLMPFIPIAFLWVKKEICGWLRHPPPRFLERNGRWSYSLYLVHFPVLIMMDRFANPVVDWIAGLVAAFAAALVFYTVIERPSHALARSAAKWVQARLDNRTQIVAGDRNLRLGRIE